MRRHGFGALAIIAGIVLLAVAAVRDFTFAPGAFLIIAGIVWLAGPIRAQRAVDTMKAAERDPRTSEARQRFHRNRRIVLWVIGASIACIIAGRELLAPMRGVTSSIGVVVILVALLFLAASWISLRSAILANARSEAKR